MARSRMLLGVGLPRIFLMLISLSAVPLALAPRKVKLGGAVHMGH